jgi:hypothetical protein
MAWDADNSDGSKSRLGWRVSADDPTKYDANVRHFDIAGEMTSETVFRHDGSRIVRGFDIGGTETWVSFTQIHDVQARPTL